MIDIVIPANNEMEFTAIAEKLGYKGICFLYSLNGYLNKQEKPKKPSESIQIYSGILANAKDISKIKEKLKNGKVFVAVRSSNNDRDVMERSKADMIFCFEGNGKRDFIHQRASGLNHILCKSAKDNNLAIGFSVSSILNAGNKQVVLGRIMQNMQLCKKFRVKTAVASFAQQPFEMRNAHDIISMFKVLGAENPTFLKEGDINYSRKI